MSAENKNRPRQLYSTVSGHLYHAGKICIVMVGLPGRGKTIRSERIVRYLDWLGVPCRAFHLANYRRDILGPNCTMAPEFELTKEYDVHRQRVKSQCLGDILAFFKEDGGQVAVYDAINGRVEDRLNLLELFKMHGIECLFVESMVTDEKLLARNVAEVRRHSPDYSGRDARQSLQHFLRRIEAHMTVYEPVKEPQLICVRLVNDGEQCVVNNGPLGYLLNRVLMYLLNFRRRHGSLFLARAGSTDRGDMWNNGDNDLNARGAMYTATLANTLMGYVSSKQLDLTDLKVDMAQLRRMADHHGHLLGSTSNLQSPLLSASIPTLTPSALPSALPSAMPSALPSALTSAVPSTATSRAPSIGGSVAASRANSRAPSRQSSFIFSHEGSLENSPAQPAPNFQFMPDPAEPPLVVWTSTRRKSVQTGEPFAVAGVPVSQKSLLNQLNLGDAWKYADRLETLADVDPEEWERYQKNTYYHRFPRGESYQDVAIRLEPLLMEMERIQSNLLIIAHESVLSVIYGYVMGLSTQDIPKLSFPANQVVEVVPDGYNNVVVHLPLVGVSEDGGVDIPQAITNTMTEELARTTSRSDALD